MVHMWLVSKMTNVNALNLIFIALEKMVCQAIFDKDVCPPFEDSNFSPSFLEGGEGKLVSNNSCKRNFQVCSGVINNKYIYIYI